MGVELNVDGTKHRNPKYQHCETINSNHPYFLHASDAPGMVLVNNLFDGKGYQGWKRSILIALSAKNKLGFITGAHATPAQESPDLQPWSRCNDMVTAWLLNSSWSKEIADSVIYSRTTKELWVSLEHRFGQTNGAKLFHLKKELSRLTQGTSNIAGYFTKLKRLWDELDSLNSNIKCACVCSCERKHKLEKSMDDERFMKFLMGLNDTYAQARGNILMINPLPDINQAYSLILQDENQRETYMSPIMSSDSSAFMVGNMNQFKGAKQVQRSAGPSHQRSRNPYPRFNSIQQHKFTKQAHKFKGKRGKYNPNVSCTYCGKTGHVADDCYRLIGFPEDLQFTNEKGVQIRSNGVLPIEESENKNNNFAELNTPNQSYNKEQYNQFVLMFKQMKVDEATTNIGGSEINTNAVAGTILKYLGSCFSVINSSTWIIDSGASEHMCFNSESFLSLSLLKIPLTINLPNCQTIQVTHVGIVSILPNFTLKNLLYVPSFKYNLMSIHRLCTQFVCNLFFTPTDCIMRRPLIRKGQIFGKAKEGLYLFQPNPKPTPKESSSSHNFSNSVSSPSNVVSSLPNSISVVNPSVFKFFFPFVTDQSSLFSKYPTSSITDEHFFPHLHIHQQNDLPNSTSPSQLHSDTDLPSIPAPISSESPTVSNNHSPPHSPHQVPSPISPVADVRRSTRSNKVVMPTHFQDFYCNSIFLSNITESCLDTPSTPTILSFHALSIPNQLLLQSVSSIIEPTSYTQASAHPG
ncbi:uncharacterized protein LOC132031763 [Lycium ferocissimum]|uniref:uncharacterized protein LOC132031763 n=1 Tax=Lycium ferocissimum TaxID=112874 RepID=UPI002815995A|nr:uncharacterized protein LOC132031763 [Lycium ferocissimum]